MMNRKKFICDTLALIGVAALPSAVFAAPKQRYNVAVIDLMILKRQKLSAFDLAKEIGADGLEVDMGGLGKYTIGKVDFTLKGYKAIVPDLTAVEEQTIRKNLEEAREKAIDYKGIKQVSAIFEIYKNKCEAYLNVNGRNWRQLFKDYVAKVKAEKEKQQK